MLEGGTGAFVGLSETAVDSFKLGRELREVSVLLTVQGWAGELTSPSLSLASGLD